MPTTDWDLLDTEAEESATPKLSAPSTGTGGWVLIDTEKPAKTKAAKATGGWELLGVEEPAPALLPARQVGVYPAPAVTPPTPSPTQLANQALAGQGVAVAPPQVPVPAALQGPPEVPTAGPLVRPYAKPEKVGATMRKGLQPAIEAAQPIAARFEEGVGAIGGLAQEAGQAAARAVTSLPAVLPSEPQTGLPPIQPTPEENAAAVEAAGRIARRTAETATRLAPYQLLFGGAGLIGRGILAAAEVPVVYQNILHGLVAAGFTGLQAKSAAENTKKAVEIYQKEGASPSFFDAVEASGVDAGFALLIGADVYGSAKRVTGDLATMRKTVNAEAASAYWKEDPASAMAAAARFRAEGEPGKTKQDKIDNFERIFREEVARASGRQVGAAPEPAGPESQVQAPQPGPTAPPVPPEAAVRPSVAPVAPPAAPEVPAVVPGAVEPAAAQRPQGIVPVAPEAVQPAPVPAKPEAPTGYELLGVETPEETKANEQAQAAQVGAEVVGQVAAPAPAGQAAGVTATGTPPAPIEPEKPPFKTGDTVLYQGKPRLVTAMGPRADGRLTLRLRGVPADKDIFPSDVEPLPSRFKMPARGAIEVPEEAAAAQLSPELAAKRAEAEKLRGEIAAIKAENGKREARNAELRTKIDAKIKEIVKLAQKKGTPEAAKEAAGQVAELVAGARAPATAKDPWQMTRDEFTAQAKEKLSPPFLPEGRPFGTEKQFEQTAAIAHREKIESAIAAGKPVPANVLADYPDLTQPAAPSEAAVVAPATERTPAPTETTPAPSETKPESLAEKGRREFEERKAAREAARPEEAAPAEVKPPAGLTFVKKFAKLPRRTKAKRASLDQMLELAAAQAERAAKYVFATAEGFAVSDSKPPANQRYYVVEPDLNVYRYEPTFGKPAEKATGAAQQVAERESAAEVKKLTTGAQRPAAILSGAPIPQAPSGQEKGKPYGEAAQPIAEATGRTPGEGAPVQGSRPPSHRVAEGEATLVRIPGETTSYKARYAVRELADIHASHDPFNFEASPAYHYLNNRDYSDPVNQERVVVNSLPSRFDPAYLLTDNPDAVNGPPVIEPNGNVLGGNNRTMILERVYRTPDHPGAGAYKQRLIARASLFGIRPADVRDMDQPVLVRELAEGELNPQRAITDFNKAGTAHLTAAERATADARTLPEDVAGAIGTLLDHAAPDATLNQALSAKDGPRILNLLVDAGVFTAQEKPQLVTREGELTPQAKERIAKLFLGGLFRDSAQYQRTAPSFRNKLERLVIPVGQVARDPDWDIRQPLREAIDLLEYARSHDTVNLEEALVQADMFGAVPQVSAQGLALANFIRAEGPRNVVKAFRQYATDSSFVSMFEQRRDPAESFSAAFGKVVPLPAGYAGAAASEGPLFARRRNAPQAEEGQLGLPVPGLDETIADQNRRAQELADEEMRARMAGPIPQGRGEAIENAPLFRGTEAAPQREIPFEPENQEANPQQQLFTVRDQNTGKQGPLFARRKLPGFYSQLQRVIEQKMPERASADQVRNIVHAGGVRADELKWADLDGFLRGKEKVTKQELLDFLRENQIEVQEVVKGGPRTDMEWFESDAQGKQVWVSNVGREGYVITKEPFPAGRFTPVASIRYYVAREGLTVGSYDTLEEAKEAAAKRASGTDTKFQQYALPGGKEYRELLLTLTPESRKVSARVNEIGDELEGIFRSPEFKDENYPRSDELDRRAAALRAELYWLTDGAAKFRGGHFDEPNVLAHVRFDDRTDADGKRVLFIEEVQSDWHQRGRKQGYQDTDAVNAAERDFLQAEDRATQYVRNVRNDPRIDSFSEATEHLLRYAKTDVEAERLLQDVAVARDTFRRLRAGATGVPSAPFKTTWQELALKRMLRWASENGYDRLAFTTGEQQAERYDLSRQIKELRVFPNADGSVDLSARTKEGNLHDIASNVPPSKVADYVGKDLADKIARGEGKPDTGGTEFSTWRVFSGLDLKVGGEGMKGFYDRIIPEFLNKYGKKWGAKVGETELETGGRDPAVELLDDADPEQGGDNYVIRDKRNSQYFKGFQRDVNGQDWTANYDEAATYSRGDGDFAANYLRQLWPKGPSVHSIAITPEMKRSVMEQGQPLFARPPLDTQEAQRRLAELNAQGRRVEDDLFTAQTHHRSLAGRLREYRKGGETPPAELVETAREYAGKIKALKSELDGINQRAAAVGLRAVVPAGYRTVPTPTKGVTARYRPGKANQTGIVYTNRAGMQALASVWDATGIIDGAHLSLGQAAEATTSLRDAAGALSGVIKDAAVRDGSVLVVNTEQALSRLIETLRHERFHKAQEALGEHLGNYEDLFLAHPLAEDAVDSLREAGYGDHGIAKEIGAHLAAGQFDELGLTHEQAAELWVHYYTLLAAQHGKMPLAAARLLAPKLREAIRERERRINEEDRGEPGERDYGGEVRPGGATEGVRPTVSAEAGREAGVEAEARTAAIAPAKQADQYGQYPLFSRKKGLPPVSAFTGGEDVVHKFRNTDTGEVERWKLVKGVPERVGAKAEAGEVAPGPGAKTAGTTGEAQTGTPLRQLAGAVGATRASAQAGTVEAAAHAATQGKERVREALGKVRDAAKVLWKAYTEPDKWTDFDSMVGKFSAAVQKSEIEIREFAHQIKRAVPDKLRREALTNYIEAAGDEDVLRERAAASSGSVKRGYELALELTPEERNIADNINSYHDAMLEAAIDEGMLEQGVEDYMMHVWQKPNPVTRRVMTELSLGKLQPNPSFIKKRVFDTYFEGEQLGYRPIDKDAGFLVAARAAAFYRAVASRAFIKALMEGSAEDGRPLAAVSASYQPITEEEATTGHLIRPRSKPEDTADYEPVNHPALRKWKWVGKDADGNPIFVKGDILIHPDYVKHVENILGRSAITASPFGRMLMSTSSTLKHTLLSLSMFHQVQLGVHALEHRVNPFGPPEIDLEDSEQMALVEHGLVVSPEFGSLTQFSEGVYGSGLVGKVPVLGAWMRRYEEYLFSGYLPRLKMSMARHALKRNRERYADKLTEDQILALTARQANAAFGALNYKLLGRNATKQDIFRLAALAPDFLEARTRFVGQALRPYGQEQLVALLLGAIVMYVVGRIASRLLSDDGDYHWDRPFSAIVGKREFKLRTIQGDLLHLLQDTRLFFYHRLNPMTLKPGLEALTGRDEFGRKRTVGEEAKDYLRGFAPIPIQAPLEGQGRGLWESILQSLGITEQKYRSAAERLAIQRARDMMPLGEGTEQQKEANRIAREMIDKIREKKATPADLQRYVRQGKLTQAQAGHIERSAKATDLQRYFLRLRLKDALDVWDEATPKERRQLRRILEEKALRTLPTYVPTERKVLKSRKDRALAATHQ